MAVAGEDGSIAMFDAQSGEQLRSFSANSGGVSDVAFSSDGETIATAGEDGTVRVFEQDGTEKLVLSGHDYLVTSIDFSRDGRRLISASADGVIRVWALDLDDLLEIAQENVTRGLTDEECEVYLHVARCDGGG